MKKTLSLLLSFVMLLSITAGLNLTAFARTLDTVALKGITAPVADESPIFSAENAIVSNSGYSINTDIYTNGVKWVDVNSGEELTESDTFIAGQPYAAYVRILADRENSFDFSEFNCTVDGAPARYVAVMPDNYETFDVCFTFSNTPETEKIDSIGVEGFVYPVVGAKPDISGLRTSGNSYTLGTPHQNYINNIIYIRDDNEHRNLTLDDTYQKGHSYTIRIRLAAKNGYTFKTNKEGTDYDLTVTLNGTTNNKSLMATPQEEYGSVVSKDIKKYVNIYFTYTCKQGISSVHISGSENFTDNGAPSYKATVPNEAGYYIDKNFENLSYVKGGIAYYDATERKYLSTNSKFEIGHYYTKEVVVNTYYDYTFDGYLSSAYYNGNKVNLSMGFRGTDNKGIPSVIISLGTCKANVLNCTVSFNTLTRTYTGKALTIPMAIRDSHGTLLIQGKDYTVTYKNNVDAGTASVTIKGIGNYTGSRTEKFKIVAKKITPKVTYSGLKFTYDGKEKRPTVKVYDGTKVLKKDVDYTVKYNKSSSKAVGEYYVKVTLKGNYSGSKQSTYTIIPKKTSLTSKCYTKKTSITLYANKQSTQTTGYQFQWSTNAKFEKNTSSKTTKSTSTTNITASGLKKNTKYYCRVRTYKTVTGIDGKAKKIYSDWSGVKELKTKKS